MREEEEKKKEEDKELFEKCCTPEGAHPISAKREDITICNICAYIKKI